MTPGSSLLFLALAAAYALALRPWWHCALPAGTAQRPFLLWSAALGTVPYLCGLVAIGSIALFPGRSDHFYLWAQFGTALALWALGRLLPRPVAGATAAAPCVPWNTGDKVLLAVALGLAASLLLLGALLPLASNDPLEYATVGREMYLHRHMSFYPLLDTSTASGMYAPWTHPPLYVGLAFISYVMQGQAQAPALFTLISPLLTLLSAMLVYWMGSQAGRRVGLLAALVFLGTPFVYSQAVNAAIDALVVQGLLLAFVALAVGNPDSMRGRLAVGLLLGLGLWSHSQAVLFPALLGGAMWAYCGWAINGRLLRMGITIVAVGLLVACWPYVRNIGIFGSPISDNNAVFALPSLDWTAYFRESRGYYLIVDRIQYGLLKGWFSVMMYGASWWFATVGLLWRPWPGQGQPASTVRRLFVGAAMIIGVYLAGMAASLLIGTDLMIRNDRYMLVLMPYVALFGGWGIWRLAGTPRTVAEGAA